MTATVCPYWQTVKKLVRSKGNIFLANIVILQYLCISNLFNVFPLQTSHDGGGGGGGQPPEEEVGGHQQDTSSTPTAASLHHGEVRCRV